MLSQLSARAAVDEPCWKVAKAIAGDGLLTALASVLHIFLRITLYLSAPFATMHVLSCECAVAKSTTRSGDFQGRPFERHSSIVSEMSDP